MSLSTHDLKRRIELGDKDAEIVMPLRLRGNHLMATMMFGDVLADSALAMVITRWTKSPLSFIISAILITIVGHILPVYLKPLGLKLSAKLAPLIKWTLMVTSPVTLPMGHLLSNWLGDDDITIYSRDELFHILDDHRFSDDSDVTDTEIDMISHALRLREKKIKDHMTAWDDLTKLKDTDLLDDVLQKQLMDSAQEYFPVLDKKQNLVGILEPHSVDIISKDSPKVLSICKKDLTRISQDEPLSEVLKLYSKTKSHIFIVTKSNSDIPIAIVTPEDVIDEIFGQH